VTDSPSAPLTDKPLADITVLDLTVALAGPFATLMLAGLGARVIKIEGPDAPDTSRSNAPYLGVDGVKLARDHADDISISALNRLRNKLGVTLNLKHERAPAVFADLLRQADVVVENFSRGTLDRLGVGYEFARSINPRIVYCSITGFGNTAHGPSRAMDATIQALSGMMQITGEPSHPPARIGLPIADLVTPLFGVIGLLSALHMAKRTGLGQHVDVSMLGAMSALMANEAFDVLESLGVPLRTGQTVPRLAPFGVYPVRDGHIAICAPTDAFVQGLFRAMGAPALQGDARYASRDLRVRHSAELDADVSRWTQGCTCAEALAQLSAHGVPAAPVRHPGEATRDPIVLARAECVPLTHPTHGATAEVYGSGVPITFSGASAGFDQPPPALGEHNQRVYGEQLGYDASLIAELRSLGVI
jgi:crotonobetainyl-CoA:carnitine CoA-transferase CaiB-like acyl-CoA transferase